PPWTRAGPVPLTGGDPRTGTGWGGAEARGKRCPPPLHRTGRSGHRDPPGGGTGVTAGRRRPGRDGAAPGARPSSRPPVPRPFRGGLVGAQPVAAGPEPGGAVPPARRIAALPLAADQVGAGGDAGPAVLGVEQVGGPGGAHRAQGEVLRVVDEAGP